MCYDQVCHDIEVVVATKWCHYLFNLQQYFSALGTVLPKAFMGAFSSNSCLNVHEVEAKSVYNIITKLTYFLWNSGKHEHKEYFWNVTVLQWQSQSAKRRLNSKQQQLFNKLAVCWHVLFFVVIACS